jgi:hypothetical protein
MMSGVRSHYVSSAAVSTNPSPRGGAGLASHKASERVVRSPPRLKGNKPLAPKQKENGRKSGGGIQPKQSSVKHHYEVIEVPLDDSTFVKSDESSPKRAYQL